MEYLKIVPLLLLGICVVLCGAVEQQEVLSVVQEKEPQEPQVVSESQTEPESEVVQETLVVQEPQMELLTSGDSSQTDVVANATADADDTEGGARKVRQYFGPPPPLFYGGLPPPYYGGGGFGGFGGGYGGFGGGYGFQRTRVVTRTRYRGRYGGFGGGFGGVGFYG
ncbi:WW domain-containing protein C660.06 [Drosophila mojavensis]|uniref:DUF4794 domain-containing protein n=1 Tax=Drosophila mojavensis TaxID=7230 RepID=B4KRM9_DROMO|nr:WW domain-containing protein C660.06 [Drosophila mojavensis]EDW08299.1 uncharacterized protein Dmoj_GI19895 [Drosophila mojavensis]